MSENYVGKHLKMSKDIKRPMSVASFHGESWYKCPKCKKNFKFYDTQFERGFTHIRDKIYLHDECMQMIDMT